MISLKDINITTEMLGIISQIDEFKGSWNAISRTPEKLQSLKKVATIESIGSSNRIEGNILSDRQVETILSNIKKQSFSTRDEQEVIGYADLMENIFDNYEVMPFTENYIKQLHKILLSYLVLYKCSLSNSFNISSKDMLEKSKGSTSTKFSKSLFKKQQSLDKPCSLKYLTELPS